MTDYIQKQHNMDRRKNRIRSTIRGTSERPRLAVYISNYHVTAQIIDDQKQQTLVYVTTVGTTQEGNMSQKAAKVGEQIAAKATKAKIKRVVFDRSGHLYHGRVKALAEAARAGGLEF